MAIKIAINRSIIENATNLHPQDRDGSIAAPEAAIATKNVPIIPIPCIIRKKILFFILSSKNYLHAVVPTQNPGLFVITLTAHAEATLAVRI